MNELAQLVDERSLPAIGTAPGFRAYYAVGDGVVVSVNIFEDPAGAEESNRMAADFVREDLASLRLNPPVPANYRESGLVLWLYPDSIAAPERRPPSSAKPTFESALRIRRIEFKLRHYRAPRRGSTA